MDKKIITLRAEDLIKGDLFFHCGEWRRIVKTEIDAHRAGVLYREPNGSETWGVFSRGRLFRAGLSSSRADTVTPFAI